MEGVICVKVVGREMKLIFLYGDNDGNNDCVDANYFGNLIVGYRVGDLFRVPCIGMRSGTSN